MSEVHRGDYARVNGLNLYYEVHGDGRPLIGHLGLEVADDIFYAPALASAVAPFLDAPVAG